MTATASQSAILAYLGELEDIPGTTIFTAARARKGYWLNQFAMSLMKPENRDRFRLDEHAYLDAWPLSAAMKDAVLARNYNRLIDLGSNIYFLVKLISTDGQSVARGVSSMTDMDFADYTAMMLQGGRSPDGNRSIRENEAAPSC